LDGRRRAPVPGVHRRWPDGHRLVASAYPWASPWKVVRTALGGRGPRRWARADQSDLRRSRWPFRRLGTEDRIGHAVSAVRPVVGVDPAVAQGHPGSRENWRRLELQEDGGDVLADEVGRPCHPDTISEWFVQKVMTSGLPRIRLHDYRHTAASLMLAAGVPVKVCRRCSGTPARRSRCRSTPTSCRVWPRRPMPGSARHSSGDMPLTHFRFADHHKFDDRSAEG
jgi:hypothetical protein